MADRLSGVAVIICIAFGVMTFILLFIFAKRQITRFTIKSRFGPHVPIGHDAPKGISQEIDRQLETINKIQYTPKLFHEDASPEDSQFGNNLHRVLVLDIFSLFENKLASIYSTKQLPNQELRSYLLCLTQTGPLAGCGHQLIHKFVDVYEHARYEPKEFKYEHYLIFIEMLEYLYKCMNQYVETAEAGKNKTRSTANSSKHTGDINKRANRKSTLVLQPSSHAVKTDKLLHETTV